MKKLISFQKKKIKSLDLKKASNLKNRLNNNNELKNSFKNSLSPKYNDILKKNITKDNQREINILSNENLKILKRLSTFAKEEITNDSIDFSISKKNFSKLKSIKSVTKSKDKMDKPNKVSKIYLNKSGFSTNSQIIVNKNKLKQNYSFHKSKSNIKKRRGRNSAMVIKSKLMSKAFLGEIKEKKMGINFEMKTKINYTEFMNQMEIMKINFYLRKNINFLKLKKKFSKIKNSLKGNINLNFNQNNNKNNNNKDKFRILKRKKELYDSFDDDEYKEELLGFFISPESLYIKIFDGFLLILSAVYSIIVPFMLSFNYFEKNENYFLNYILILIDIIYILDVILNCLRGYRNFDEHLIFKKKKILKHYLKNWFFIDFLQAIPLFSLFIFNIFSINSFNFDNKLPIILLLKMIKLYKMIYHNHTITNFSEIISSNEIVDNYGGFILSIFIILLILNMTSCLFIFLGNKAYPGWILKINIQDEKYIIKYLTSIYFIIVTITTVGYGDITGVSNTEIGFQIYLLIIGTIAYSYTISYISNMVIKINNKSMSFEKNMGIIQEIKLHHPNMKDSLYNEVLRNIYNMRLYEKKDNHILLDSLPYSLKNKLIINMHQHVINNFIFFKNIDNSDFIAKVVTSFVPIISIKDDIVIQEGNYITEIIFVKRGVISLNINFDLNNIESSLKKYIYKNQIGKYNVGYSKSDISSKNKLTLKRNTKVYLDSSLSSNSSSSSEKNANENKNNIVDIKIVEIRKNEHFGDALMFLNERSPINAKIRTKNAELLMLRKIESIEIYSLYPNIWKRINKISLHNMEQIYLKIKKSVIKFAEINEINLDNYLVKRKKNFTMKTSLKKHNNKNKNKNKKITFNEESIISNMKSKLTENKNDNKEKFLNLNDNKNSNIINIMQPNNINFNLYQIKNTDINLDLKKQENLTNISKIKSYFNNSLDEEKKLNSEKKLDSNEKRNSSISVCFSKVLDETLNFNLNKSREKIIYNSFSNLKQIKEKNFTINSSYENINKLSNDKYIKDTNLQLKIKNLLVYNKDENNIGKITYLNLPKAVININKKNSFKTLLYNNINAKKGDLTHKNFINTNQLNANNKNQKFNSSKRLFNFTNGLGNNNNNNSPDDFQRKINKNQTKKKPDKINKQLNIITKNIENTNDNINNPDIFYSKFFKNIINKERQINNTYNSKTPKIRKIENKNKDKDKTNLFKYYMKDKEGKNNNE